MSVYTIETIKATDLTKKHLLIPETQRLLDNQHFTDLYNYQKEHYTKYGEFFFPNPIIVCVLDNDEYIIDGQHRIKCIKKLCDEKYKDFSIFFVKIKVTDKKEIEDRYNAINKNEPVKLYLDINSYKSFHKPFESYINNNYSKYIKNTDNPRPPNINLKHLRDYTDNVKVEYDVFITEFEKLNMYYKKNPTRACKNVQEECLLFYYKKFEWVDRIIYSIENKVEYKDMSHEPISYRVKIKKQLRKEVLKKRNSNMEGLCYCCEKPVEYDNFECGHINSVFLRGETTLSNLEPICSMCNNDMGIKNLLVYKSELKNELL